MNLSTLLPGRQYSRSFLSQLWGYKSFNAISRGVFSPKGEDVLVFFITKEKQNSLTQYEDHIDTDILFWEGEKGHGSDQRIISRKDTIHIFYRDKHHMDFTYEGRAVLRSYCLCKDRPSKFSFDLIDGKIEIENMVAEIQSNYGIPKTEREAIVNSRVGQGLYRKRAIDLWKTCSVTGFSKSTVLVASHIKPWKLSSNEERMNPYNSLLLVPSLDKLFDTGYIGFEHSGKIMLSGKISSDDWERIGVDGKMRLRDVPEGTKRFLDYHGEYVFDLTLD